MSRERRQKKPNARVNEFVQSVVRQIKGKNNVQLLEIINMCNYRTSQLIASNESDTRGLTYALR